MTRSSSSNTIEDLGPWERRFEKFIIDQEFEDASHDVTHVRRVVETSKRLCSVEKGRLDIVVPAAWLHDCVAVEKDSPNRSKASTLAAEKAREFLFEIGYPSGLIRDVSHAIEAHSFSAGIAPRTIEAQIVQDADRLEALGAIGLARCMMVGSRLGLPIYDSDDPFCQTREPDDRKYILDHFFVKLLELDKTMHTASGKKEARRRKMFLNSYLDQLRSEITERLR